MMDKILVTGGTGFIGSHTVVELQQAGYDVVIMDNLCNSHEEVVDEIMALTGIRPGFVVLDLLDKAGLNSLFEAHAFDAVIHFAGLKAVGKSCEDPFGYWHVNILGTMQLLEVMDAHDVRNLVFSSSATVYDASQEQAPFDESMRTGHTTNPYGTTKHVIEKLLEDMVYWKDMSVTSLRYFNPIGAHPSGTIGENPSDAPNNLFPILLEVLEGKREKVSVYGNNYDTIDGTGVRDYIHVVDLAQAHVVALEEVLEQEESRMQIYNVGTGRGTSVVDMIQSVEKITGLSLPYEIVAPRDGDIGTSVADVGLLKTCLGRTTTLTIEDAIRDGRNYRKNR